MLLEYRLKEISLEFITSTNKFSNIFRFFLYTKNDKKRFMPHNRKIKEKKNL